MDEETYRKHQINMLELAVIDIYATVIALSDDPKGTLEDVIERRLKAAEGYPEDFRIIHEEMWQSFFDRVRRGVNKAL